MTIRWALVTPADQVLDRSKATAAAALAVLVADLLSARRWSRRAFEIEQERRRSATEVEDRRNDGRSR